MSKYVGTNNNRLPDVEESIEKISEIKTKI